MPEIRAFDSTPLRVVALIQFVIYEHPLDYPEHFVVRKWYIYRGKPARIEQSPEVWALTKTLADARRSIPPGLALVARDPADEPQIVESWL